MYEINYEGETTAEIIFDYDATIDDLIEALGEIKKRYGNLLIAECSNGLIGTSEMRVFMDVLYTSYFMDDD
jgi:hypothetical protein